MLGLNCFRPVPVVGCAEYAKHLRPEPFAGVINSLLNIHRLQ